MNLTLEELKRINEVQTGILRETAAVCDKLGIPFYMVHGSLLGTIRNEGFVPYDDDIDIAIPRKDYERFLSEAQNMMPSGYFVQSDRSDKNYPLEFAKVRDSRTTYIVENVRHIDMNHGIYIDVFPIDSAITDKYAVFLYKLYSLRIGRVFELKNKSLRLGIKQLLACCFCPSLKRAVQKRNQLLLSAGSSDKVRITGGKPTEVCIPEEWFGKGEKKKFEGVDVVVPADYHKYLSHIYGNYAERTLVEGKMAAEDKVSLNACIADVERPYTYYTGSKKTN